jgi:hypothetical protein
LQLSIGIYTLLLNHNFMARFLWTQKQDFGPKPRTGHTMVFDSTRKKVVLFGGDSLANKLFNDTWEWDGEFWTQMADIGPDPRSGHSMAYDSINKHTVIFGGTANNIKLGDTWNWEGDAWTQLSNTGPQPRSGHATVFNKSRNTILLFGGEAANSNLLGDTWEFNGTDWTQLDEAGPAPRKLHSMTYDRMRNRVVLFGGMANGSSFGDTWELDGTNWIQTADFGPERSVASSMAFTNSRATLYGGISSLNANPLPIIFNNSWDWDGKHWTQRQDIGPGARWGQAMCYDRSRASMVLFGGVGGFDTTADALQEKVLGDTWEHIDTSNSIVSLDLFPDAMSVADRSTGVVATVTLNGIVAGAELSITIFSIPKRIADTQPLPTGTQPYGIALGTIIIPRAALTGSVKLLVELIAETAVISTPQLNDPSVLITAILTVIV